MKKLFMFMTVVIFAAFCFSCGSDDKPVPKPEPKPDINKLELVSDAIDGKVRLRSVVTLTVKNGDEVIKDAKIFTTNGAVVIDGEFAALEPGKYSFSASKEGYANSAVVDIEVLGVELDFENDVEYGKFILDDEVYDIGDEVYLNYWGEILKIGKDNYEFGVWEVVCYNDIMDTQVKVRFTTPISVYSQPVIPNRENVVPLKIEIFKMNGSNWDNLPIKFKEIKIDLGIEEKESDKFEGEYSMVATYEDSGVEKIFKIKYKGGFYKKGDH